MRTGLNLVQTNILDANKKIEVSWLFEVDLDANGAVDYYWAPKEKTWLGQAYTYDIHSFSRISMDSGNEVFGLQSPASISIDIVNEDNAYTPSDFEGASITIRLIMKADLKIDPKDVVWEGELEGDHICEAEILSWTFKVKTANSVNRIMTLECVDWLLPYLEGDYPNQPLIKEIFPVERLADDNYCVPETYGECFFPLRWTRDVSDDFYVLGPSGTYTTTELRSPKEWGSNSIWLEAESENTFTHSNKTGADSNTYRVCEFLIVDTNDDDAGDSNGIFGDGDPFLDPPCAMYNSSTQTTTNPIEIIKTILLDFGVPSTMIDNDAYTEAYNTWDTRSLDWNVPLYYKQSRSALLSKLLILCDSRLIVRDKLYFKVNSATSQHTVTKDWVVKNRDVVPGNFRVSAISTTEQEDGCYITYSQSGEPITDLVKVKIPAYTSSSNPSTNTIEAEYINDSVKAQKIGILTAQKLYNRALEIMIKLKSKCLQIECGDVITIDPADYNAVGGSYDALITHMSIGSNGFVDLIATKYKHPLRNWGDLSPAAVTPEAENITTNFTSVISGTSTPGISSGTSELNVVNGVLRLGGDTGHVLLNSPSSFISIGDPPPTTFGNNEGVWLGISSSNPKLSLYKDANNYMQYDPSASPALIVKSELHPTGSSDAYSKAGDTLDNVSNGSSYGRVAAGDLDVDGHIILTSVQGDLDDISDGSSYSRVLTTDISAGHIVLSTCDGDLDDVTDGSSYGKVLTTHISSGVIKLSSENSVAEGTLSGASRVILSSSGLSCYNSSSNKTVEIKTDGDVKIGDYDNNKGIFYDNSAGSFYLKCSETGKFVIKEGGDFELEASGTNPGLIKFTGTSIGVVIGNYSGAGSAFVTYPDTDSNGKYYLGILNGLEGFSGDYRWDDIGLYAHDNVYITCGGNTSGNMVDLYLSRSSHQAYFRFWDTTSYKYFYFEKDEVYPGEHKDIDFGRALKAFDDIFCDDLTEVADVYHFDDIIINGEVLPICDTEVIQSIQPSDQYEERTGFRIIDDSTLPDWLLKKDKRTLEILRDPDGKPYLSLKAMISLNMGAVRELDDRLKELEEKFKCQKKN